MQACFTNVYELSLRFTCRHCSNVYPSGIVKFGCSGPGNCTGIVIDVYSGASLLHTPLEQLKLICPDYNLFLDGFVEIVYII